MKRENNANETAIEKIIKEINRNLDQVATLQRLELINRFIVNINRPD